MGLRVYGRWIICIFSGLKGYPILQWAKGEDYSTPGSFSRIKIYGRKKSPCEFPKAVLQIGDFVVENTMGSKRYSKEYLLLVPKRNPPPGRDGGVQVLLFIGWLVFV